MTCEIPSRPYQVSAEDTIRSLDVMETTGLSSKEAKSRLAVFGRNELERVRQKSLFLLFLEQFKSPLAWVLAIAAILAFGFQENLEGIAILIVILINALIGFFMEWQARDSMKSLQKLSQTYAKVYRDGQLVQVEAKMLVPGDVVFLEAGDIPAADMRILENTNLGINESALTGESVAVSKQREAIAEKVMLADQKNMLFRGTVVIRGNARAVVVHTGKHTEIGKIAKMTREAVKSATPLEKKLLVLSRKLIWLAFGLAALVCVIGILQGRDLFLVIEIAIALGIAAVPEGLPVVATIALARGMLRLARHNVIIKKLNAVETLGETQVIITDKTGTLTENQMLPETLCFEFGTTEIRFVNDQVKVIYPDDQYTLQSFAFSQLQKVAALCNNASLDLQNSDNCTGDPLEIALLRLVEGSGKQLRELRKSFPRIKEIPFDSGTKMMGTLHKNGQRPDYLVCIKGALEVVLEESDYVLTVDGRIPMTKELRSIWLDKADALAVQGLRVLGFGYSEIDAPKEDFFSNITFIGFVGFLDPPRESAKKAVEQCKKAGIKVVMATGDHPGTAGNIGYKVDIIDHPGEAVTSGPQLKPIKELSPEEEDQIINTSIFARVDPAQKLSLVEVFQKKGFTVGMTGDGVNDAPALKKADIGIAMGTKGTEAAKEASDMVLKDDQFTSILDAIRQGRGIFSNIRYFVIYLLSCNLSELLIVSGAFLANLTLPLLPLQILFMNMITDVFPALALGMNKVDASVMDHPPRPKGEPIVSKRAWGVIVGYALAMTLGTIGVFLWSIYYLKTGDALANNMAFYTLILAQLWHVFNLPDRQSPFKNTVTQNPYIWLALILCGLIVIVVNLIPSVKMALQLQDFSWELFGWVMLFSWLPVLIIQLWRRLF